MINDRNNDNKILTDRKSSPMKKIKWGIVGPGVIARQFAWDFRFCKLGELTAVASRNIDNASAFAKRYKIEKAYGSYDELFNDEEIDVIYIATPHTFHFEQTSLALKAGKAVLCEKPLTVSLAQAKEITALARSESNYLMEGLWTYFLPPIKKALEWVQQNRIGKILHVKADFGYPFPYDEKNRWFNPDLAGGALLDLGIYCIAMAWLFNQNDPKNINVIAQKASSGVDTDVSMQFEYENSVANLTVSLLCKLHNWAYIIGEKGYIAIQDFWRSKQCFLYEGEKVVEEYAEKGLSSGMHHEIDAVNQDILDGKKESEIMPYSFSLKFQELMDAVKDKF